MILMFFLFIHLFVDQLRFVFADIYLWTYHIYLSFLLRKTVNAISGYVSRVALLDTTNMFN